METQRRIGSDDFAAFVRQLYRLFKTASIHLMNNQAVTQAVDRSVAVFNRLGEGGFDEIAVLFLNDTVFVNGTLLKASRDVYDAALELAALLRRVGANQLTVSTSVTADELMVVVAYASERLRGDAQPSADVMLPVSEAAALRLVDPELLDDAQTESMTAEDKVGRAYASALVVMRFLFDNLKRGQYSVSRQIKRIAQQLVVLAAEDEDAFLAVTRMRQAQDDEGGRAVNSAILAILAGRELTHDVRALSRLALSTLLADVGRPRAAEMGAEPDRRLMVIPRLTRAQRAAMPRTTALVLTALGRLHQESLHRTVVGFEAQWLLNRADLPEPYDGEFAPRLESSLVAMSRAFNDLLTLDVTTQTRLSPDDAIGALRARADAEEERLCAELLFQAVGLISRGSVVRMASGYIGVVVANSDRPGLYGLPRVQLFADPSGARVAPTVLDLAHPNADVVRHGGVAALEPSVEAPSDLPQPDAVACPPPRRSGATRAPASALRPRVEPPEMPIVEPPAGVDDDIVVELDSGFPLEPREPTDAFASSQLELDEEDVQPIAPPPLPVAAAGEPRARTLVLTPADMPAIDPVAAPVANATPANQARPTSSASFESAPVRTLLLTPEALHAAVELSDLPAADALEPPRAATPARLEPDDARESGGDAPVLDDFGADALEMEDVPVDDVEPQLGVSSEGMVDAANADLDALLAEYFGSEPIADDSTGGANAADHTLGPAREHAYDPGLTGPLPSVATGEVQTSIAESLLRDYFPDSPSGEGIPVLRAPVARPDPAAPAAIPRRAETAEHEPTVPSWPDRMRRAERAAPMTDPVTAEPAVAPPVDVSAEAAPASTAADLAPRDETPPFDLPAAPPEPTHSHEPLALTTAWERSGVPRVIRDPDADPSVRSVGALDALLSSYLLDSPTPEPPRRPAPRAAGRPERRWAAPAVPPPTGTTDELLAAYLATPTPVFEDTSTRRAPTRPSPVVAIERQSGFVAGDAERVAASRPRVLRPSQRTSADATSTDEPVAAPAPIAPAPAPSAPQQQPTRSRVSALADSPAGGVPSVPERRTSRGTLPPHIPDPLGDTAWDTAPSAPPRPTAAVPGPVELTPTPPANDATASAPARSRAGAAPARPGRPVSLELELVENVVELQPGNPFENQRAALARSGEATPVGGAPAVAFGETPAQGIATVADPMGPSATEVGGGTLFGLPGELLGQASDPSELEPRDRATPHALGLAGDPTDERELSPALSPAQATAEVSRTRSDALLEAFRPTRPSDAGGDVTPTPDLAQAGAAHDPFADLFADEEPIVARPRSATGSGRYPATPPTPQRHEPSFRRASAVASGDDRLAAPEASHDTVEIPTDVASAASIAARRALAPRSAAATPLGVRAADAPADTLEVSDEHASHVLRDFIVARESGGHRAPSGIAASAPLRADGAITAIATDAPTPTPRAAAQNPARPVVRPSRPEPATSSAAESTREVTGGAASDILRRYLTSGDES
ncbi:MAG: hypothetical protein H6698_06725 [Myxococcales bacterium]|nr:hypothetical protein [Myxococcales bacterium]MCB9531881.1 hypothetical protein [Myxococcales bacterium]MCB9534001.1 hypothetical protein [Myxococcales bacterium]